MAPLHFTGAVARRRDCRHFEGWQLKTVTRLATFESAPVKGKGTMRLRAVWIFIRNARRKIRGRDPPKVLSMGFSTVENAPTS